jgi:hypothetical protein
MSLSPAPAMSLTVNFAMQSGVRPCETRFANGVTRSSQMVEYKLAGNHPPNPRSGSLSQTRSESKSMERSQPRRLKSAKSMERSQPRRPKSSKSINRSHDFADCIDCMDHRLFGRQHVESKPMERSQHGVDSIGWMAGSWLGVEIDESKPSLRKMGQCPGRVSRARVGTWVRVSRMR